MSALSTQDAASGFLGDVSRKLLSGYAVVWVVTYDEVRALRLLSKVMPKQKLQVWTATRGMGTEGALRDPAQMLQAATASAQDVWWALLDLHPYFEQPLVVRALRDFIVAAARGRKALVIISPESRVPTELERDVAVVPLPLPSPTELTGWWRQQLTQRSSSPGNPPVPEPVIVRAAEGLSEVEARRAFRAATADGVTDPVGVVLEQKRAALRRGGALRMIEDKTTLEDIGGLQVLKSWMQARVGAFGPKARAFGLPEPRGVMVCGVQGCGKSLVAKVAAKVFGMPLVRLDFAEVFGASSPELTMRRAIETAEAVAPVVLWIDEIEKGLGAAAGNAGVLRVFGDFLIWLQEKSSTVFVAATANEVDVLPPELVRRGRFDDVFFVDLPGRDDRAEILAIHLRRRGRDPAAFDLAKLAVQTDSFSGSELEQLVIAAMFHAFAADRKLQDSDLQLAARETVPLATMYEDKVQQLRQWAETHARLASPSTRTLDLFK